MDKSIEDLIKNHPPMPYVATSIEPKYTINSDILALLNRVLDQNERILDQNRQVLAILEPPELLGGLRTEANDNLP